MNSSTEFPASNPLHTVAAQYNVFWIKQGKKSRLIQEPKPELKKYQQSLLDFFNDFPFLPACTARPGFSTLANAAPHQGANILWKTDIKSFYPSVSLEHLVAGIDLHHDVAWRSDARTRVPYCLIPVSGRLVLPTGAPTSPVLCNIAATGLDHILHVIALKHGFTYTRYIDDLTFSSRDAEINTNLPREVFGQIYEAGFVPNKKKTEWVFPYGDRPFAVTGVNLSGHRNKNVVPKDIRRIVRARLNNIARDGVDIDTTTKGYLSYVKMLDHPLYEWFVEYLAQRKARYADSNSPGSCPGSEQVLPSNAGDDSREVNSRTVQAAC